MPHAGLLSGPGEARRAYQFFFLPNRFPVRGFRPWFAFLLRQASLSLLGSFGISVFPSLHVYTGQQPLHAEIPPLGIGYATGPVMSRCKRAIKNTAWPRRPQELLSICC